MTERRRIDVIKLDEKALWRLHEKLKKIQPQAEENVENVTVPEAKPKPVERRRERKPAKFQVYQPGITRLSNRPTMANFDRTPKTSTDNTRPTKNVSTRQQNEKRPYGRGRGRGRGRIQDPLDYGRPAVHEDHCDETEGFLSRHRKRVLRGESDEDFSEDELAWDNYGGSGLVQEGWSPQVTATETSSQGSDEMSDRELYSDLDEDEHSHHNSTKVGVVTEESEEEPSAATSESNKDFYKVTHSISSQSDNSVEDFNDDQDFDNKIDSPQLYDPANPEQPIIIKRSQSRAKVTLSKQQFEDNVYNPRANRDRMMSKVVPAQPRQEYRRRRQSPCQRPSDNYHGNRYLEDSYNNYEPGSPITRHRHYSENLSEDEDTVMSHSRTMRHQSRIAILVEAERYEDTLSNLLASPSFDSEEYSDSLTRVRNKVKSLYEKLIVSDIEAASTENLDQKLWKNVYYQVIEILREQNRSYPEHGSSELRDNLILLLDQGTAFYESLLENLQQKHRFNLKEILNSASARKRHRLKAGKRSMLAILSCQRVFICLGDIARYREQATHTNNYGRARHCYLQAQLLAPKNGRPYNQLAILAVKTRHKLDAVYYYVRSLVASNPILSARESLMALFDEVRRKLDYVTHKQDDPLDKDMKGLKVSSATSKDFSKSNDLESTKWKEVWILPGTDAERRHHNTKARQEEKDDQLPELKLSPPEIVKHFTLYFLNIHGKLFTRIGLEIFPELLTKTIKLFEAILTNRKFITTHRMLQLFTVNLFAVLNAEKLSIHGSAHDSTQNQRRALRLAFSMLAITVNHLNKLFRTKSLNPFISEEIAIFLPAIKIMFDWMYTNKNLWYPPPEDLTDSGLHIWANLATLCSFICNDARFQTQIPIYNETAEGLHEIFLTEDTQLAGYSPLGQAFSDPRFVQNEAISVGSKTFLQQSVRISLIREFLEYLCGMEEPLLAFKQGKYVSVTLSRSHSWGDRVVTEETPTSEYDADEYSMEGNDSFLSTDDVEQSGEIHKLRKLKETLQIKKDLKDKRENQMKTSLESEERVKMEIFPKYLVPDTNCFIDYLDLIKKLISCGKFKIATPLVVVGELEGLTTDKKDETSHAEQVQQNASKAVSFIKKCISENHQKFCILTKKGTELKNLRFRSEVTTGLGNNDDFILQSAHGYARLHNLHHKDTFVDGEKILHRNVVLLTDDRNLRLKALLTGDTPARSIKQFCTWINLK